MKEREAAMRRAVTACRDAYCGPSSPKLPECDSVDAATLGRAILVHDLGPAGADSVARAMEEIQPAFAKSNPQTGATATEPALKVSIAAEGVTLKTSEGKIGRGCIGFGAGPTVPMKSKDPLKIDVVALRACARKLKDGDLHDAPPTAELAGDFGVPFGALIDAIDAIRKDDKGELFPEVTFGAPR
jgi:hypothetical protein